MALLIPRSPSFTGRDALRCCFTYCEVANDDLTFGLQKFARQGYVRQGKESEEKGEGGQ